MITLLILLVNMWWIMFTGDGFIHGNILNYLAAGMGITVVEIVTIVTIFLLKIGEENV